MNCDILPYLFTLIGALAGIALGAWLNSKYSLEGIKKQEFLRGASEFRCAFVDIIQILETKVTEKDLFGQDQTRIKTILDDTATIQEKVYITFRQYLSKSERVAFKIAWKYYLYPHKYNKATDDPRLEYNSEESLPEEIRIRELVYKRLSAVLKFAEFE